MAFKFTTRRRAVVVRTTPLVPAGIIFGALGGGTYGTLCGAIYGVMNGGTEKMILWGLASVVAGAIAGAIMGMYAVFDRAMNGSQTQSPSASRNEHSKVEGTPRDFGNPVGSRIDRKVATHTGIRSGI